MKNPIVQNTCGTHDAKTASQASVSRNPRYSITMHDVLERGNLLLALKRVRANKGAAGVDNLSIEGTAERLKSLWPTLKEKLLSGSYKPLPVRLVYIPKPGGKGRRMLGIPSVTDRIIQQAILQKLTPIFDGGFSPNSYGFRPKRSALQAVKQAHQHLCDGKQIAVDIDLEKFFDVVNHDRLMAKLAKKITDKPLLKLIRFYLQSGMMESGVVTTRKAGTPQGSPLSPLLSNIVLDELDKELERRGHHFVRYADDIQIHVRSKRSGQRVLESISRYIETKLKLKVNAEKSKVGDATRSSLLGYSFIGWKNSRIRCSKDALKRLKHRVRQITRGHRREAIEVKLKELDTFLRGWAGYYRLVETKRLMANVDSWIRSRLRMCQMKLWFFPRTRVRNMIKLGLSVEEAKGYGAHKRWWFYAQLHHTRFYLNNEYWRKKGYRGLCYYLEKYANV